MNWRVIVTKEAEEDIDKLDLPVRNRVLEKLLWLRENFDDIVPLPLGGRWRGFFKLRIGDWRVIYESDLGKRQIVIHYIGRRDKIYK